MTSKKSEGKVDPSTEKGKRPSNGQAPRAKSSAGKRPVERVSSNMEICATIEPGTLIGDYRVIQKLDEGGMGTVYEGVHPVIGKRVAIKALHPHVARQDVSVARFIQEARAVNAIGHREIVDVFGFGKLDDGRQYIVMEFLKGRHLLSFLNENGPLEPLKACSLVRLIAGALEAAHKKGVIHRDLKPENVFLLPTKREIWPPEMKLLDFGLAKLVEDKFREGPQTRMGATVGTPYYMAPEQCRGRTVDARTDVYALGVMFYELITGRVPFYAEQPVDVLYMHLTKEPDPPSMWAEVPEVIEKLILDCMNKPPELRPSSMNAVIARIEHIERQFADAESSDNSSFADLLATTAQLLGAQQKEKKEGKDEANEEVSKETSGEKEPHAGSYSLQGRKYRSVKGDSQNQIAETEREELEDQELPNSEAPTPSPKDASIKTEAKAGAQPPPSSSPSLPSEESSSRKEKGPVREPTEQISLKKSSVSEPIEAGEKPPFSMVAFALGGAVGVAIGFLLGLVF